MTSDDLASEGAPDAGVSVPVPARAPVRFSAEVARALCLRVAAGEPLLRVCEDTSMPTRNTVHAWARRRPAFGRVLARAKASGGRFGFGRKVGYCEITAGEIAARVAEGETMTSICADPAMPGLRTVYRWRADHADFDEAMRQAREALAERFSDLGWQMAQEATPETAYLTWVRLGQLRWTAALLGPRTHGKLKPTEPAKAPEVETICFRHFDIEVNRVTGQRRVIGWTPDPTTMTPVRDHEGEWKDPIDPVAKAAGIEILIGEREGRNAAAAGSPPDDPEGWC
jgi:hypothetical protein